MPAKDEPEAEVIREKMWVSRPRGTHLSQSQKTPGDFSPLTRGDESEELGHVTLSPVGDEDEYQGDAQSSMIFVYNETAPPVKSREQEAFERAVSDQVSRLVDYGIAKAKPHVQQFWYEKARPAIQSKWESRPRRRRPDRQLHASEPIVVEATVVDSPIELMTASEKYRRNMSSAEAQARYMMALAAKAFSDEQMRIVANADIDDGVGFVELERTLTKLPPQQVAHMIENLEANPSLLIEGTFDLGKVLELRPADGDYLPIEERRDEQKGCWLSIADWARPRTATSGGRSGCSSAPRSRSANEVRCSAPRTAAHA